MEWQFLFFGILQIVFGYKKVILIPGLLSERSHMVDLKDMIQLSHPGTDVVLIDLYPQMESFIPLNYQLKNWQNRLTPIMEASPEGVHLICHSQGGLICQGIIENMNHNVHTFIALSCPLFGQFGIPMVILKYVPWFKGILREKLTKYMYTRFTQDTLAIANYWKDPRKRFESEFLSISHYLPFALNQPDSPKASSEECEKRKKNFVKLQRHILIGGPDDGVIEPWQSSIYGFYDENLNMIGYKDQPVYKDDWFGLRTLDETGRLHVYEIPGVKHVSWHGNKTVFKLAIEPWLD